MKVLLLAIGLSSLTSAFDRGDLDEAARQGMLAGPVVVEKAIAATNRATRLAGIVAAPAVEDRVELLPALAVAASGPDRRTAIPAARAARAIARSAALADDLAPDDFATWRAAFEAIARAPDHCIEVRVLALDTAAALGRVIDPGDVGFDLVAALGDSDPAIRAVAVALVPQPAPEAALAALAATVANDADRSVALGAAQALCGDASPSVLAALGARGLDRIRTLVGSDRGPPARDAARCLKK